jgi:hypothetical protein
MIIFNNPTKEQQIKHLLELKKQLEHSLSNLREELYYLQNNEQINHTSN